MGRAAKQYKTKRYARDANQILDDDLSTKARVEALKHQKLDEYLPGMGQFYCVPCARYCESERALHTHQKSKVHKRSIRQLRFGPYTPEEAESGAGRDVEKYLRKRENQLAIHREEYVIAELSRHDTIEAIVVDEEEVVEEPATPKEAEETDSAQQEAITV